MTLESKPAKLEGYNQLRTDFVDHLNRVVSSRCLNNLDLEEIGMAVSFGFQHSIFPKTSDGYTWFGRLDYTLDGSKIAILFPWHQDFDNSESQMDRSINVYASRYVDPKQLDNLLESVAYQTALRAPDLSTLRFVPSRTYDKK